MALKLYGGTDSSGLLFEWNDTDAWVQVAPQLNAQVSIRSLVVLNSKLYGGTDSSGLLFEWNDTDAWVQVAPQLNAQVSIRSLVVFNGKIYGSTSPGGRLFEWNGSNAWVQVAPQLVSQADIYSLAVFNSKLYGGTGLNGRLFEWNDSDAWVQVAGMLNSQTKILSLAVFNSKLYGGTAPGGRLFEWNGTNAWVQVAPQVDNQTDIWSLAVFNSKLYGGTGGKGELFEWNGTNAWRQKVPQLVSQADIYSLAVFNSKLYGGTGGGGRLFKWDPDERRDYTTIGDDSAFNVDVTRWMTQTFTTSIAYDIRSVKLLVSKSTPDPVGSVVIAIRAVDGSRKPTGSDLCSVEISDFSEFDLGRKWIEFVFDSPASLSSGIEYAIIIKGEGYLSSGYVVWYYDSSTNLYLNGHFIYSTTEGVIWTSPGLHDALFETYSKVGAWEQKAPQLSGQTGIYSLIEFDAPSGNGGLDEVIVGEIADQYTSGDDDSSAVQGADDWLVQTFTASVDYTLRGVRLKLLRSESPGDITVSIRNVVDGDLVGGDVLLGTLNGNAITTESDGEWYWILLGSGHGLEKGVQYAIVIRALEAIGDAYVKWREQKFGNGYPGGKRGSSGDAGDLWTMNDEADEMFEVYGDLPISDTDLDIVLVEGGDVTNKIKESVRQGVRRRSNFVPVRPFDSATGLRKE